MSYPVKLIIFSLFVTAGIVSWNQFAPEAYQTTAIYFVIPFFIIYSFLAHRFLTKALGSDNKNAFTLQFMGATGIKLFVSLIVLVVFGVMRKAQIVPFAILYLFIYFAFTGFETVVLFRSIKQQKTQQ